MDSTTFSGQMISLDKLDEVGVLEANKQVVESAITAEGPITPDNNREDFSIDCSSPLTALKRPSKLLCFDSSKDINEEPCVCIGDRSPQTPKDGVFDPFAPCPNDSGLAPLCKKYIDEERSNVARRLNFDSSAKALEEYDIGVDGVETISDEEMFESVYENLLDAIVTKQFEVFMSQIPDIDWDPNVCKTPPSAPCLNGFDENCPDAPMKASWKSRKIDMGLCRKLEFDNDDIL
ncbi:hypothetical protein CFOL_v3_30255 [Cephalotus follicularis]|uniref:Uncharacterized protein n=1 Tax=Cephalotus follicularis TaxID=3775 RepID=A0A1Q3D2Y7_CEPFO|nr:hypothetical protein CFOL_v3_30255 [Cephalotus follicularis]